MAIYNYLFFKGYQLAVRSRNFDDMPVLGAVVFVGLCLMLNIFTISLLLEGFNLMYLSFEKEYKFLFSIGLVFILLAYYLYQNRYKKILKKYELNEQKGGLHPIIVFILYYGISFGLLLLAAMFKNGDGMFSK